MTSHARIPLVDAYVDVLRRADMPFGVPTQTPHGKPGHRSRTSGGHRCAAVRRLHTVKLSGNPLLSVCPWRAARGS
jgi:hypothetical protein